MRSVILFVVLILSTPWLNNVKAAAENRIAIFYPSSFEPYRSIYQRIIEGSHSQLESGSKIFSFVLNPSFNSEKIIDNLRQQNIRKVIVLGRLGYRLASELPDEFSVVTGAIPNGPNSISGISLISDPDFLFRSLSQVAPKVKRIHIAYSKSSNWIIQLAVIAAKQQGYQLNLKKVQSTREAIEFYQLLFESNLTSGDAIWLPVDPITSHDKIILPIILEKAWAKDIVVFSSKPSHAKRGALFSTYPDNYQLGQMLIQMVNSITLANEEIQFVPLMSLQLAVNLRTAAHLGLKYSNKDKQKFKLMFPE